MLFFVKFTVFFVIIFDCDLAYTNHDHNKQVDNHNGLFLVHILFRHGDRTPQRTYPKDIYKNTKYYYPYGLGQLTNKGKFRMYDMGVNLRKYYEKFWGGIYNQSKIEARSSGFPRTRMSCELVMAGMFQPNTVEQWHPHLHWQPTLCDYIPQDEDSIFLPERTCKAFAVLKSSEIQKDKMMGKFEKYKETFDYFRKNSGLKMETPADVTVLYDILRCQNELGLSLPKWTHDYFPYPMSNLSILDWDYIAKNDKLKKLSGGILFKTIIDNTRKKIDRKEDYESRKIFIYSGHDSNMVPMLEILGIYKRKIMPYGAAIVMEIHQINMKLIVKIFVQDSPTWNPKLVELPNCKKDCTFEKFTKAFKNYLGNKEMCSFL